MSAPDRGTPNDETIEAAAAAWMVEKEEGLSPEQETEFARWLAADPRHARALAELQQTCGVLHKMPLVRDELSATRPVAHVGDKVVRFPRVLRVAVALAACVIVGVGVFALRGERIDFSASYAAATDLRRVALPDGSAIELNAGTEVRVELAKSARRLVLQRGEAHFSVAKDASRPFTVRAADVEVTAVGTAFSVKRADPVVEVIVTEGRIAISRPGASRSGATPEPAFAHAGQRVVVNFTSGGQTIEAVDPATASALAWQAPKLVFGDQPLGEVVRQFNRHNRVQLEVADAETASRTIGGTFRADHVETFVKLLEDSGDVAVERPSAERIVLRKPAKKN